MSSTATTLQRILIVDDEPNIRELLATVLEGPSRSIHVCNCPAEALEYLQGETVDLAFLDMLMPGMTGLELAKKIKEQTPDTRIALCTGYVAQDVRQAKADSIADFVVQKPFDISTIMELADNCARN